MPIISYRQKNLFSKRVINKMTDAHEKQKKLCEKDVIEIKKLIKEGFTLKSISEKYNVVPQTISDIKNWRTWCYVRI